MTLRAPFLPLNGTARSLALVGLLCIAACGKDASGSLQGYAEADYLYLSARETGEIAALGADDGDWVQAGALLVLLDDSRQRAGAERAAEGLAEAKAAAELARQTHTRTKTLRAQHQAAQAQLDQATSTLDAANARVREAQAALLMAQRDLADRTIAAPAAGRIEEVFRRTGERAGPNEPIIALLPPENIKVRFFLPEPMLGRIKLGDKIIVTCDACGQAIGARISFISAQAQYTPPFIFSREERAKLVFLVEARPDNPAALRPGQPLDVELSK